MPMKLGGSACEVQHGRALLLVGRAGRTAHDPVQSPCRELGYDAPGWNTIREWDLDDVEPGMTRRGWQHLAAQQNEQRFLHVRVCPQCSDPDTEVSWETLPFTSFPISLATTSVYRGKGLGRVIFARTSAAARACRAECVRMSMSGRVNDMEFPALDGENNWRLEIVTDGHSRFFHGMHGFGSPTLTLFEVNTSPV